jgi:hypothetical protein
MPALAAAGLALSVVAEAHYRPTPKDVTVEIVDENGATFTQVPIKQTSKAFRAYLQAERDARYRIRVTNRSGQRVGLVVAVDGRNIINGARSDLQNTEPMYILGPYGTEEYGGWRSSLSDVHEFYFTEWPNSYAEAFGDRSARGVIAVAIYKEKAMSKEEGQALLREQERQRDLAKREGAGRAQSTEIQSIPDRPAPSAGARDSAASPPMADSRAENSTGERRESKASVVQAEPGTGYGNRREERAVRVDFDAESRVSSQVFLKYEWRETLCRKGVLDCSQPENRFWPDALSFAPPPPQKGKFD